MISILGSDSSDVVHVESSAGQVTASVECGKALSGVRSFENSHVLIHDKSKVAQIVFRAQGGNDQFDNQTNIPSLVWGGDKCIASAFVERFATDPEPLLFSTGTGGPVRRKNDIVLAISTNFGSVSEDIMNRALENLIGIGRYS